MQEAGTCEQVPLFPEPHKIVGNLPLVPSQAADALLLKSKETARKQQLLA